jgi:hypothetical protein
MARNEISNQVSALISLLAPHFDEYSHSHSILLDSFSVVESLNAPSPSKHCHTLTEEQLEPRVDYNSSVPALVDQLTATSPVVQSAFNSSLQPWMVFTMHSTYKWQEQTIKAGGHSTTYTFHQFRDDSELGDLSWRFNPSRGQIPTDDDLCHLLNYCQEWLRLTMPSTFLSMLCIADMQSYTCLMT